MFESNDNNSFIKLTGEINNIGNTLEDLKGDLSKLQELVRYYNSL